MKNSYRSQIFLLVASVVLAAQGGRAEDESVKAGEWARYGRNIVYVGGIHGGEASVLWSKGSEIGSTIKYSIHESSISHRDLEPFSGPEKNAPAPGSFFRQGQNTFMVTGLGNAIMFNAEGKMSQVGFPTDKAEIAAKGFNPTPLGNQFGPYSAIRNGEFPTRLMPQPLRSHRPLAMGVTVNAFYRPGIGFYEFGKEIEGTWAKLEDTRVFQKGDRIVVKLGDDDFNTGVVSKVKLDKLGRQIFTIDIFSDSENRSNVVKVTMTLTQEEALRKWPGAQVFRAARVRTSAYARQFGALRRESPQAHRAARAAAQTAGQPGLVARTVKRIRTLTW